MRDLIRKCVRWLQYKLMGTQHCLHIIVRTRVSIDFRGNVQHLSASYGLKEWIVAMLNIAKNAIVQSSLVVEVLLTTKAQRTKNVYKKVLPNSTLYKTQ